MPAAAGKASAFSMAASAGNIASSKRTDGGITGAYVVEYKDDGRGCWKHHNDTYMSADREVAAYRLNKLMGGSEVPETVIGTGPDGKRGSAQFWIKDAQTSYDYAEEHGAEGIAALDRDAVERVIALDYITGNEDRHPGNWLVKDGQIVAIDHGFSRWDSEKGSQSYYVRESRLVGMYLSAQELMGANKPQGRPSPYTKMSGSYRFSSGILDRWSKITREEFDSALTGINAGNTDSVWSNFQDLIDKGAVTW